MLKVYISSSYDDLREERAAVREPVQQLGLHPIGMDQDSVSERRPLGVGTQIRMGH